MTEWVPHPGPQTWALQRSEDLILMGGSRGGCKTETGLAWGCEPEYISNPRFRGLVIRKSSEDLGDWIFRARKFYDGLGVITGKPPVIRWSGGGETVLGHWKDRKTLSKYIGQEFQKINVEELTQTISTLDEYLMLLGSLRSSIKGMSAQFYASTNPGGTGHKWVKKFFVDRAKGTPFLDRKLKKSLIFIPSTIDDNPSLFKNDPGYVAMLDGLPEPLRSAWRLGDWDCFEGQFFSEFSSTLQEDPFYIPESDCAGRLFGSLDLGTSHDTSFGLWYLDRSNYAHRLFSYLNNGYTHSVHAEAVYNKIASFKYTHGMFPSRIVYCRSGNTASKNRYSEIRRPIDEYIDIFKCRNTRFELAFDDKHIGCPLMLEAFNVRNGYPFVKHWRGFNESYEAGVLSAIHDPNDSEVYKKTLGDDACDEARYGIVLLYTILNDELRKRAENYNSDITPIDNDFIMNSNYGYINDDTHTLG